ncbi:MAG TPA: hypothetical protein VMD09_09380 [Solirubrobacteraceae bacterium]|nr:hypothetical protein [Solirubrobacteraceae bacterium]
MSTKAIRTSPAGVDLSCDVCGRTLLRGERAHPYLDRGAHRTVCELCTARAEQEGWLREGTVPDFDGADTQRDRRRSLFGRLRRRRDYPAAAPTEPEFDPLAVAEPIPAPAPAPAAAPPPERPRPRSRETRHVRAIPTSAEHRIAFAIEAFNASEHPRTVAGVGRSLGLPSVSVRPVPRHPSVVHLVISWELCWYRYEFDLADEDGGVRLEAQGQELSELTPLEQEANAACDEHGRLSTV